MIRELGEAIGDTVVESVGRAVGRTQEQRPLPADVLESEDAYLVVFDAPGVEPGDVQVQFDDGSVEVRVDRFREFREGYEMRFPGRGLSMDGQVRLPKEAQVDPAGATATLRDNGTLQVRLPKIETDESEEPDESSESVTAVDVDETETADSTSEGGKSDSNDGGEKDEARGRDD